MARRRKKAQGEKVRRKGTGRLARTIDRGEKARRKNVTLEMHSIHCVVPFQCHFQGAFYCHTKEPLSQFLHLNAFYFRCRKRHCSVTFLVPLMKHIFDSLRAVHRSRRIDPYMIAHSLHPALPLLAVPNMTPSVSAKSPDPPFI